MKEPPLRHWCFICITLGAFWKFGVSTKIQICLLVPTPGSGTVDIQQCSTESQSQLTFPLFWLLPKISKKFLGEFWQLLLKYSTSVDRFPL